MKVITFLRMPLQQKIMFGCNFFLCGVARVVVRVCSFKRISTHFGACCKAHAISTLISSEEIQRVKRLQYSIKLAAKYTPWNSNCLAQALVAIFWCRCYRIPCVLFIGDAKLRQSSDHEFHAWVTAGPIAITGGYCFDTHRVFVSYADV